MAENVSTPSRRGHDEGNGTANDGPPTKRAKTEHKFQPGAVMRVRMTNFVTYSLIEFTLGEALNMIIGPNGTGKSTLVCALCIGLNGAPSLLGRAKELKEFVKNDADKAKIEIEVQGFKGKQNMAIRRDFDKNNKTQWFINNKKVTQQQINIAIQQYNIQVDNLCQFLPQDKVADFAKSTPQMLLQNTERAVGGPDMIKTHEELIELGKELVAEEHDGTGDRDQLAKIQEEHGRQAEDLRAIEELDTQRDRVSALNNAQPMVELQDATKSRERIKIEYENAKAEKQRLIEQAGPFLALKQQAEEKLGNVDAEVRNTKANIKGYSAKLQQMQAKIETLRGGYENYSNNVETKRQEKDNHVKLIKTLEQKAEGARMAYEEQSTKIDHEAIEAKQEELIAKKEERKEIAKSVKDQGALMDPVQEQLSEIRPQIERNEKKLEQLANQANMRLHYLQSITKRSPDWKQLDITLRSINIVRQAKEQGALKGVFEPPVMCLKIRNNSDLVKLQLSSGVKAHAWLTFTCETAHDMDELARILKKKDLNPYKHDLSRYSALSDGNRHPITREELKNMGFEAWMSDMLDGPEPVKEMLRRTAYVHAIPITSKKHKPNIQQKLEKVVAHGGQLLIQRFLDRDSTCGLKKSKYGKETVSLSINKLAQRCSDLVRVAGGDASGSRKEEFEQELQKLRKRKDELMKELQPLREKKEELAQQQHEIDKQVSQLKEELDDVRSQREKAQRFKITYNEKTKSLKQKLASAPDFDAQIQEIQQTQAQHAKKLDGLLDADHMLKLVEKCNELNVRLQSLTIQATTYNNEIEVFNRLSRQGLEEIEMKIREYQRLGKECVAKCRNLESVVGQLSDEDTASAKREIVVIRRAMQGINTETNREVSDAELQNPYGEDGVEFEALRERVHSVRMRVEASISQMEEDMPDATRIRREYEQRQDQIDRLKEKVSAKDGTLQQLSERIQSLQDEWEPKLEQLIGHVSTQFSKAFADIGCKGEVQLERHPTEYHNWAIKVMVAFRENQEMQPLTPHRQSGGERAVSTVLYLMSLQELARSPFRVVDEINQGMDPGNERMVHNRMVDVACQENTSQYFLITPKLLTNLHYADKMKVSCIFSGPHVSETGGKLTSQMVLDSLQEEEAG